MKIEIGTFAVAVLGSSVVSTLINVFITKSFESRKSTDAARHLAIRLAIILEKFSLDCSEAINERGVNPDAEVNVPNLPDYPDEDGWRVLDDTLLERSLTLRHELVLARQTIYFTWQIELGEEAEEETIRQCGHCGWSAWQLARDLRHRYDLAAFDPTKTAWDFAEPLKPLHDEVLLEARKRNSK